MSSSRSLLLAGTFATAALLLAANPPKSWTIGPALLHAGSPGTFDDVAVKDPSIVRHNHRWHLFYTARNRTDYTLGYVHAAKLEDLSRARRHLLKQLHAVHSKYAAAPQVFYFRPHQKWYLFFQTTDAHYQPVYSTTTTLSDPASWSRAKPLVAKQQDEGKWIDFWVICDERLAYLFFTRNHRDVVAMTTKIEDFPNGFSQPQTVFSPVHEAVHVYRVQGPRPSYAMVYEQQEGDRRRFGLARAPSPAGPWTVADEYFATGKQLRYPSGTARWTDEVSHGELLRAGWDERLEIPSDRWQLLVQGMPASEHHGEYPLLPWRLGLLSASID